MIERFEQLEGERYLVITGDHGQLLGEQGRWGHNDLQPQVAEVPVLIIARDAPPDALQALSAQQLISCGWRSDWAAA